MNKIFQDEAWEDILYWVRENRKVVYRIYELIRDIEKNGAAKGVGKPERLKHYPGWSRRIDKENRLIYKIDANNLHIISCKGHYDGL